MGRWQAEDGTILMLVLGLTVALLATAGLVYDGGRLLAARSQAFDAAQNAARVGGQAVDLASQRSGGKGRLHASAAASAASDYLAEAGYRGNVTISEDAIQVTVTDTTPLVVLRLIGLTERTVTGRGEARLVHGISAAEAGR